MMKTTTNGPEQSKSENHAPPKGFLTRAALKAFAGKALAVAAVAALAVPLAGLAQSFNLLSAGLHIPFLYGAGSFIVAGFAGKAASALAGRGKSGLGGALDAVGDIQTVDPWKAVTSFGWDRYQARGEGAAMAVGLAAIGAAAPFYLTGKSVYDNFIRPA